MSPEEVSKKVYAIVSEVICLDNSEGILPGSRIIEDLGADSSVVVEVALALKEAFDLDLLDEDLEKLSTVCDLVNCVTRRLG